MTSQERREISSLRSGDRSLRQITPGVMNSEDIRLAEREENWRATDLERVIRNGHPADREIIRRQALERITQYSGSKALGHLLPLYRNILDRVDRAILADAERHLEYLGFCVARDERQLERARQSNNPFSKPEAIEASIARYRTRIAEVALWRLSEAEAQGDAPLRNVASDEQAGGGAMATSPLAFCPA